MVVIGTKEEEDPVEVEVVRHFPGDVEHKTPHRHPVRLRVACVACVLPYWSEEREQEEEGDQFDVILTGLLVAVGVVDHHTLAL